MCMEEAVKPVASSSPSPSMETPVLQARKESGHPYISDRGYRLDSEVIGATEIANRLLADLVLWGHRRSTNRGADRHGSGVLVDTLSRAGAAGIWTQPSKHARRRPQCASC